MNPLKRILGHIYFFYGLIMFLGTMLIIVPVALIALCVKDPLRSKIIHPAYKFWISLFLPFGLIRLKRKGKEKFVKDQNYVVIINHNSFVDIPISTPWIPGPNKTLAKIELSKIPIFGWVYKAGSILVDRKDPNSKMKSFTQMQETLKMGLHLALYPEGTRNKTDKPLQPFIEGAFVTAIRSRKPIIPCVIFGTKNILSANGTPLWAWPHHIEIHFLDPIETKDYSLKQRDELSQKAYNIMNDYIIANNHLNN